MLSAEVCEQLRQAPRRGAEIGAGEHDAGAHDADPNLAHAHDRKIEDVAIGAAGRAERIACEDCRGEARQRRRVGSKVAQQRGNARARRAPQRQTDEKTDAILREPGRERDNPHRAHHRSDHAEPSLAQRRAKMRLAHQGRGSAGPICIVELEPKRDVESKTDGRPQPQSEYERGAGRPHRRRHGIVQPRRKPRTWGDSRSTNVGFRHCLSLRVDRGSRRRRGSVRRSQCGRQHRASA